MREVELPLSFADGLEAVAVIIGEGIAGGRLPGLEDRQERNAVDLVLRCRRLGRRQQGRDDVDIGGQGVRLAAGLHDTGPADDQRHTDAALESRALAFTERAGGTGVTAEVKPRSVVAGEDDDRLLLDLLLAQGAQDRADGMIEIRQGVGVRRGVLALEFGRSAERRVRHRSRQVEEERLLLAGVILDEPDRPQTLRGGQRVHIDPVTGVPHEMSVHDARQLRIHLPPALVGSTIAAGPHVVRVRRDHRLVEAMGGRQELRGVAQVPFTDDPGVIACLLQERAQGLFVVAQADLGIRAESRAAEPESVGIASGQEGDARGGADRLRGQEVREAYALFP